MRRCGSLRSHVVWKTDGLLVVVTNFNGTSVWESTATKKKLIVLIQDITSPPVSMKRTCFWNVAPCNMVDRYQYSGVVNSFEVVFLTAVNKFHKYLVLLKELFCELSKVGRLLAVLSRLDTRQITPNSYPYIQEPATGPLSETDDSISNP
jgi:hypothetical protein